MSLIKIAAVTGLLLLIPTVKSETICTETVISNQLFPSNANQTLTDACGIILGPNVIISSGARLNVSGSSIRILAGTTIASAATVSLNSGNGSVYGTSAQGDAGTYHNIVISIFDESITTLLPAFSINVDAPQVETLTDGSSESRSGSFYLSWVEPEYREDGTPLPLSEIAGYSIFLGPSPGYYTSLIDVAPLARTLIVTDMPVGAYYVVITTIDTEERESTYSKEIIIDVQ